MKFFRPLYRVKFLRHRNAAGSRSADAVQNAFSRDPASFLILSAGHDIQGDLLRHKMLSPVANTYNPKESTGYAG